jgi:hypothetical protein
VEFAVVGLEFAVVRVEFAVVRVEFAVTRVESVVASGAVLAAVSGDSAVASPAATAVGLVTLPPSGE